MLPFEEVVLDVLALGASLEVVELDAHEALGLVLAEPVIAEGDVPSFANSAMDGFALRAADTTSNGATLRIIGRVGAGASADAFVVGPGEAVRIMTGAPVPEGADAVVMVERTREADGHVTITGEVLVGDSIRRPGEDVMAGATLLAPRTVLTPLRLGVVAAAGRATVRVHRRPVVGVFSTGDELVDPPAPIAPPQIRNSNRPMLIALARRDRAEVIDLGNVPDDDATLDAALADACARCDLVVTSGGVSMGDRDLMKQRLRAVQVAIKPSKPLAFGLVHDTPVVGLPGNPVSAAVSYVLFVRPLLRRMCGHALPVTRGVVARLAASVAREPDGKTHLIRVTTTLGEDGVNDATPIVGQASHQLAATAGAAGFVVVPDGDGVPAGTLLRFIPF